MKNVVVEVVLARDTASRQRGAGIGIILKTIHTFI